MIGAPPINKLPIGLLGFLGIKNGGRNPDALSPLLAPTWDAVQWYLSQSVVYETVTSTFNVTGGNTNHTVPEGFVWAVLAFSVRAVTAVGGSFTITPVRITANGTSFPAIGDTVSAGASSGAHATMDRDILVLRSGDSCGFTVEAVAGGPISFNSYICYVPMPA